MAQHSPGVGKALGIIGFLAGHPEQAFTLSEIAKSLHLSSATCHNLLTSLLEEGYVFRTIGKTYVLGPELSRVGQASMAPALVMQVLRPEMRALADDFDVVCTVSSVDGDEVVVRERAASASHLKWTTNYFFRTVVKPPQGAVFVASSETKTQEWLAKAEKSTSDAEREDLLKEVEFLRSHGFSYGTRRVPLENAAQARELQNQQHLTNYSPGKIDAAKLYDLAFINAPIHARPHVVAFAISLAGFVKPVSGASIEEMAARLREASDRVSRFIAGREML